MLTESMLHTSLTVFASCSGTHSLTRTICKFAQVTGLETVNTITRATQCGSYRALEVPLLA